MLCSHCAHSPAQLRYSIDSYPIENDVTSLSHVARKLLSNGFIGFILISQVAENDRRQNLVKFGHY